MNGFSMRTTHPRICHSHFRRRHCTCPTQQGQKKYCLNPYTPTALTNNFIKQDITTNKQLIEQITNSNYKSWFSCYIIFSKRKPLLACMFSIFSKRKPLPYDGIVLDNLHNFSDPESQTLQMFSTQQTQEHFSEHQMEFTRSN